MLAIRFGNYIYIFTIIIGRYKNNKMEINLILLAPDAMLVGWQYFKPETGFNFNEINIYLLFFQIQLRY